MKKYHYLVLLVLTLISCKKEKPLVEDFGYDYYPNEIGYWVEYEVTEINHDISSDTSNYLLREQISAFFFDQQGRKAQRVERFWRTSSADEWEIKDVWYANVTTRTAEKVEENVRFVKLNFPIRTTSTWDGNDFNTQREWLYGYDSLHIPRTISGIYLDSTIKVVQRNNFNLVEYEKAYEIYAKHIGLVKKEFIDLDINNFNPQNITKGKELYQQMTNYGKL
ncbi:MAG: hypothetical protein ACK4K0_00625 [Flavobacteriales bacterium]